MTFYNIGGSGGGTFNSPQIITLVDANGVPFLRTITNGVPVDTALDGTTGFTPTDPVGLQSITVAQENLFTDANGITFWRFSDGNNAYDREIDGVTPFTPQAPIVPASSNSAGVQQDAQDIDIGGATGTIAAGATSVSVLNKSLSTVTWNGVDLDPGESQSYTAADGNTLDAFPYDTTGAAVDEIQVTEVR